MKLNLQTSKHSQLGAGMIEVLVSLLILGVGLMGVLSLQANGSSSNQRAIFVTEAQILAQDMTDRLKSFGSSGQGASLASGIAGSYNGTDTGTKGGTPVYSEPNCDDSGCSDDQTVDLDQYEWEQAFDSDDSSLPNGRGQIFWDGIDTYTIRILWDQDRTGAAGLPDENGCNNATFSANKIDNLTCYDTIVRLYQ